MIFPDVVEIRPAEPDEYGNPGAGPGRRVASVLGFLVSADVLLLPPSVVDISTRDRLVVNGTPYAIEQADEKRSPSRRVLWLVKVARCPRRPT